MNGPATRLAMLGLALSLALPAGWCCGSSEPPRKTVPAAQAGCPHCREKPRQSSAPNEDPSGSRCCCQRLATVKPIEKWQPGRPLVSPVSSVGLYVLAPGNANRPSVSAVEQAAGPSLQLLHCVWRC
ncbi:MAG TPA: hypothetical protein VG125_32035 [Pirellulales bacterium]|nr:hypothetical protein [Pirellulales bacterium]